MAKLIATQNGVIINLQQKKQTDASPSLPSLCLKQDLKQGKPTTPLFSEGTKGLRGIPMENFLVPHPFPIGNAL